MKAFLFLVSLLASQISLAGTGRIVNSGIADNAAINYSKMQSIPSHNFLGNNTGVTGPAAAMTPAQSTALLSVLVGDTGTGGVAGICPAPGAGDAAAGKYLKADGTWATVSSSQWITSGSNIYYSTGHVGVGGAPGTGAALDVFSTTGGLGLPVMTTAQRDASTPARNGVMIYNSDNLRFELFSGGFWTAPAPGNTDGLSEGSTNLYYTNARARAAISGTAPISYNSTSGAISCITATGSVAGCLSAADYVTFNAKQAAITTGTSSQYLKGDLTLGTFQTDVRAQISATAPIAFSAGAISCAVATGSVPGCLAAADFATFNAKQAAITTGTTSQYLRGDLSLSTFAADVIASALTGLSTATSTAVVATDSILVGIGKLQAQVSLKMSNALTSAHIFVGNVSNVATDVALSQDGTLSNAGALTIISASNPSDDALGLAILGQGAASRNAIKATNLYTSTSGNFSIRNAFESNTLLNFSGGSQGRVGLGNFALGHPDVGIGFQNQSSLTTLPTVGIKAITSQSADLQWWINASESRIAGVTVAGAADFASVQVTNTGAAPTCSSTTRGTFFLVQGGAGVKDIVEVCAKDAADAYAWRSIY